MRRLLTITLAFLTLAAMAQTLHFHQLTVKDGLSHNSVITLAQDAKGNIWVATYISLLRYDGRQFTPLPSAELPDKRIDRINRAPDGTMWVQCFERHELVSRYDTLTNHFVTYNVADLSDSVRQQVVLPLNRTFTDPRSSRVWTIEKRQLWQTDTLRPNSPLIYTGQTAIDAGLKDETFYSLVLDRQGILWAGSANNGLYFADTRQSYYHRIVCQPNPLVRATHIDRKGALWIGIGDQQLLMMPKGATYYMHADYPMTDSVEGRRLRAIVEDEKGRLWLGTHDGLYVREASAAHFHCIKIADKTRVPIYSLCLDKERSLWIGTDRGLFQLKTDMRHPKVELIDSTVTFISKMASEKKRLWIATAAALYCREDGKMTQRYQQAAHAIVVDPTGQIWVGTDDGLMRVTEQGLQHVSTAADGHIVKDLLCWRDFLWCSMEQGLCCVNIYTGRSTILRTEHNEYLDGSACLDTKTGTLYFGGTQGIDYFEADSLDEKLRSGVTQLWLEEQLQEVSLQPETSSNTNWYFVILGLIIAIGGGIGAYRYYKSRRENCLSRSAECGMWSGDGEEAPVRQSPFIEKAKAITEAHMGDADFTAEQMASEMAMSRSKLFLLMKKETGKAVMEFVRDIRLEHAAKMLCDDIPVADITMACGFSDPSSFRRSFAKKYGVNPSQFRSQHRS